MNIRCTMKGISRIIKDMADEAALSEKQAHDMLEEAENNHKKMLRRTALSY